MENIFILSKTKSEGHLKTLVVQVEGIGTVPAGALVEEEELSSTDMMYRRRCT